MIAPEGRFIVGSALIASVAATAWVGPLRSLPLWVMAFALFALFAERRRQVSNLASDIACPADGVVDRVTNAVDPWFERPAIIVGLRTAFPGVFSLRSPVDGKVCRYWTEVDAAEDFLPSPTCYALGLETDRGEEIVIAVASDHRHSRYKNNVAPGERIGKGGRSGFVYLASRVDLYLPDNVECTAQVGQKVRAGTDVIAQFPL